MMARSAAQYGEDLAYIHDAGFGSFSAEAAPGLLHLLRREGIRVGLVVDLGCGSGTWAGELSRAGYEVIGIDISRSMIARARARVPRAAFRHASFLDAPLPRCDAVTSLGECLNYGLDPRLGPRSLSRLFRGVRDALRPGGLFIFDVRLPEGRGAPNRRMSHREGDDWAVLVRVESDRSGRALTRRITTFRKVGRRYRRGEEVHRLRLYGKIQLATMLRQAGFRVRHLRGYGRMRFTGPLAGFLAGKPP